MRRKWFLLLLPVVALVAVSGCGRASVSISPTQVTLAPGEQIQFEAAVTGTQNIAVQWAESTGKGCITKDGLYTAPLAGGTYYVTAASAADPAQRAGAMVIVDPGRISGKKFHGVITVKNTGIAGDLTMNQQARLEVLLVENGVDSSTGRTIFRTVSTIPQFVTATVDDDLNDGGNPVHITGSLNGPVTNLSVSIELGDTDCNLVIGPLETQCTFASDSDTTQSSHTIIGRTYSGLPWAADPGLIAGCATMYSNDPLYSAILQEVTWTLTADF